MYRRLGRGDLRSTNPFMRDEDGHHPFVWRVYEDYEVLDSEGERPYLQAAIGEGETPPRCIKVYQPFVDAPYLVLEFARIVENKNPVEALQSWIHKYGLLGLAHEDQTIIVDESPQVVIPPQEYEDRGGPGETLDAIWYEAEIANELLSLYEAALNRDAKKLERLLFSPDHSKEQNDRRRGYLEKRADEAGGEWVDALIDAAMTQIWEFVGFPLRTHTYPAFGDKGNLSRRPLLTVDGITASWGARSLLGVMYLQFYWLITSGGELSRCKQCKGIIAYGSPISTDGSVTVRKPRKDKEFCGSRCRQNYHYHTRIKPERKGRGKGR